MSLMFPSLLPFLSQSRPPSSWVLAPHLVVCLSRLGEAVFVKRGGQVESSTVILAFPLISSSVVPVLSGLPVFVGAVQSQIAWPSESAGRGGRPAGHRWNEGRWRSDRQRSDQAGGGLGQDAVRHVVWM